MVATLKLRSDQIAKYRKLAGIPTDDALAKRMGIDPGARSWSRSERTDQDGSSRATAPPHLPRN